MNRIIINFSNENYEMFGDAVLIDDKGKTKLDFYCNTGLWQDSIIVYKATSLGDVKHIYLRYFPHGHENQEGNKVIIYDVDCEQLEIRNNTKEKLIVGNKILNPGETMTLNK